MSAAGRAFDVRRLLVALDASAPSLRALEHAARLAARLGAELAGLFVEEESLLQLARLPVARAFVPSSAEPRSLDPAAMERSLQRQGERARAAVAEVAGRQRLRWSFRVVRGRASTCLVEESAHADLTCLGRTSWAKGTAPRLGSTARAVAAGAAPAVLLLQGDLESSGPLVVLASDSPASGRALAAAAELARRQGSPVIALAAGADEAARRARGEAAVRALEGAGPARRQQALREPGAEAVVEAVRREGASLLVLPADAWEGRAGELERILDRARCSVLIVR